MGNAAEGADGEFQFVEEQEECNAGITHLARSGDNANIAEGYRRLHATTSRLLSDETALARECDRMMPQMAVSHALASVQRPPPNRRRQPPGAAPGDERWGGGYGVAGRSMNNSGVASDADWCTEDGGEEQKVVESLRIQPKELQKVTQYLIDRLGCRHPPTLERITSVFTGFAGRHDGLSVMEFRGYVACVLTQLFRELESRCAAAGVHVTDTQSVHGKDIAVEIDAQNGSGNACMHVGPNVATTCKPNPWGETLPSAQHNSNIPFNSRQISTSEAFGVMNDTTLDNSKLEVSSASKGHVMRHAAAFEVEPSVCIDPAISSPNCAASSPSIGLGQPNASEPNHVKFGSDIAQTNVVKAVPEPLSDLQLLTQELNGFQASLTKIAERAEQPMVLEPAVLLSPAPSTLGGCVLPSGMSNNSTEYNGIASFDMLGTNGPCNNPITEAGTAASSLPKADMGLSELQKLTHELDGLKKSLVKTEEQSEHTVCQAHCKSVAPNEPEDFGKAEAIFPMSPSPPSNNVLGSSQRKPSEQTQRLPQCQPPQHLIRVEEDALNWRPCFPENDTRGRIEPETTVFATPATSSTAVHHSGATLANAATTSVPAITHKNASGTFDQGSNSAGQSFGMMPSPQDLQPSVMGAPMQCLQASMNLQSSVQPPNMYGIVPQNSYLRDENGAPCHEVLAHTMPPIAVASNLAGACSGCVGHGNPMVLEPTQIPGPGIGVETSTIELDGKDDVRGDGSITNTILKPLQGAKGTLTTGWTAFANTMDKIFVPEAQLAASTAPTCAEMGRAQAPAATCPDKPLLTHAPTAEGQEVHTLLCQEGIPVYVGVGEGRGFMPKRLCLDGSGRHLYIIEPDAYVPSVFLGVPGFSLQELRRIVHDVPRHPDAVPLLSLEFEEGFLPVRLSNFAVLHGLKEALQAGCDGNVDVIEQKDWQ